VHGSYPRAPLSPRIVVEKLWIPGMRLSRSEISRERSPHPPDAKRPATRTAAIRVALTAGGSHRRGVVIFIACHRQDASLMVGENQLPSPEPPRVVACCLVYL